MMRGSRWLGGALGCALSLASFTASADSATAEALFEEGVQLVARGELSTACQKFEASESLDVAVGTLLRLADCYERTGRLASAWSRFREAASLAQAQAMLERQHIANVRAEALGPRLAKLRISVTAQRPEGFRLELNGTPVPEASFDLPLPIDSGPVLIVASAPGYLPFQRKANVPATDGARVDLAVPPLEPDLGLEAAAPSSAAVSTLGDARSQPALRTGAAPDSRAPREISVVSRDDTRTEVVDRGYAARAVGLTFGVLGGAGLVTSGVLAVMAQRRNSASFDYCTDDHRLCNAHGVQLRHDAGKLADAATVSLAVGGGLLLSGLIVYFAAPRPHVETAGLALAPELGLSGVGLRARGAF